MVSFKSQKNVPGLHEQSGRRRVMNAKLFFFVFAYCSNSIKRMMSFITPGEYDLSQEAPPVHECP